jgi:hypothetical protein
MKIHVACSSLWCWLLLVTASPAQERVALFYSMPEDGGWVEYEWRTDDAGKGQPANRLRISSVGKLTKDSVPCRWIEVHKETHRGDQTTHQLRKLLVAESKDAEKKPGEFRVLSAFAQRGLDAPATSMKPKQIQDLVELGFHGSNEGLVVRAENEDARTGLGVFRTRHVETQAKINERTCTYHAWLTPELPFGWAKFEVREQTSRNTDRLIFSAVAVRKGNEARSEMRIGDHSK